MKPKKQASQPLNLFQSRLDQIIDLSHPLCIVANQVDWNLFESSYAEYYSEKKGAPGKPIRLMVGLLYLKNAFNESDEGLVAHFLENPYWQYFCGYEYFQHEFPIDPSSLSRFRGRIGEEGVELMLKALLKVARGEGLLTAADLRRVNVDTTVQEKAIAFPTDARLYHKMRVKLVAAAEARKIRLRQNYRRVGKQALLKQGSYTRARQMKRAKKMTRKLKTYLGRVYRDILRKCSEVDDELERLLKMAERLLAQKKKDKNKLYSIHAPEVECIGKGKAHKPYEFGCKVSLATSSAGNWILGAKAFHGNPYDGHTLAECLEQLQRLVEVEPQKAFVDYGYRGHDYKGNIQVELVHHRYRKPKSRWARKWMKRRSAIEPIISHVKHDHRMNRNHLKGKNGDKINAILAACGFNFRKLLRAFFLPDFAGMWVSLSYLSEAFQAIWLQINVKEQDSALVWVD